MNIHAVINMNAHVDRWRNSKFKTVGLKMAAEAKGDTCEATKLLFFGFGGKRTLTRKQWLKAWSGFRAEQTNWNKLYNR